VSLSPAAALWVITSTGVCLSAILTLALLLRRRRRSTVGFGTGTTDAGLTHDYQEGAVDPKVPVKEIELEPFGSEDMTAIDSSSDNTSFPLKGSAPLANRSNGESLNRSRSSVTSVTPTSCRPPSASRSTSRPRRRPLSELGSFAMEDSPAGGDKDGTAEPKLSPPLSPGRARRPTSLFCKLAEHCPEQAPGESRSRARTLLHILEEGGSGPVPVEVPRNPRATLIQSSAPLLLPKNGGNATGQSFVHDL